MRFEIRIDYQIEITQAIVLVLLFTRDDEYYLNGGDEGIYNCASTIPDNTEALISIIEKSVNACIETFEKESETKWNEMKKMMDEVQKSLEQVIEFHKNQVIEFHKNYYE